MGVSDRPYPILLRISIDYLVTCTYNICISFEYDPRKARSNWEKHGVSFADAESVFFDPLGIHDIDPDLTSEDRFIAMGMSNSGLLLVVVYTMRDEVVRLISARRATHREAQSYEEGI